MGTPPQGLVKIATYYTQELAIGAQVNRFTGVQGDQSGTLSTHEVHAKRPTRIISVAIHVRTNTLTEALNVQLTVDGGGNNSAKQVVAAATTGKVELTNEDGYWGDYTAEEAWGLSFLSNPGTGTAGVKVTITVQYLD